MGGRSTKRPPYDPVEWTNKRTGEVQTVDRGLDPAWAGNPGVDRARVLQDSLAEKIDATDESLARSAVRQVVGSALLERHLAKMARTDPPKGELPIAFLDREYASALASETRLVRMTQRIAKKERKYHAEITADSYRVLLPEILEGAELVLRQTGHCMVTKHTRDLVFFHFSGKEIHKLVVRRAGKRRVELSTFYRSNQRDVEKTMAIEGTEVLRDSRNR